MFSSINTFVAKKVAPWRNIRNISFSPSARRYGAQGKQLVRRVLENDFSENSAHFSYRSVNLDRNSLRQARKSVNRIRKEQGIKSTDGKVYVFEGETSRTSLCGGESHIIYLTLPSDRTIVLPPLSEKCRVYSKKLLAHEMAHASSVVKLFINKRQEAKFFQMGWCFNTKRRIPGISTRAFVMLEEVVATFYERCENISLGNRFETRKKISFSFNPNDVDLSKDNYTKLLEVCKEYRRHSKRDIKFVEGSKRIIFRTWVNYFVNEDGIRQDIGCYDQFLDGLLNLANEVFPELSAKDAKKKLIHHLLSVQAGAEKPAFLLRQIKNHLGHEAVFFLSAIDPYGQSLGFENMLFMMFVGATEMPKEKRSNFRKKIYSLYEDCSEDLVKYHIERLIHRGYMKSARSFLEQKSFCLTGKDVLKYFKQIS